MFVLPLPRGCANQQDVFLLKCKEMVSLQRPSSRDYESVRTWFKDNQPIVQREEHFIRRKEDMITLRSGRESAVFDSLVERCLSRVDDFLQRRLRCQIIRVSATYAKPSHVSADKSNRTSSSRPSFARRPPAVGSDIMRRRALTSWSTLSLRL